MACSSSPGWNTPRNLLRPAGPSWLSSKLACRRWTRAISNTSTSIGKPQSSRRWPEAKPCASSDLVGRSRLNLALEIRALQVFRLHRPDRGPPVLLAYDRQKHRGGFWNPLPAGVIELPIVHLDALDR